MTMPAFLQKDETVFIIKHNDGFISDTTKNTFKVSVSRNEAKKYKNWQSAIKMARKCNAIEIQQVAVDDVHIITRRYAVVNGQ